MYNWCVAEWQRIGSIYGNAELAARIIYNSRKMDVKDTAEYLLKEMYLQTISQEYAGAIRGLCEQVKSEPSAESAYVFGFLMGAQHSKPKSVIRVMSENLKSDWQKFKDSFFK